jgi:hypothetical protein
LINIKNKLCGGIKMAGIDVRVKKGDIVVDNGFGVYIITQDDKEITRHLFNLLIKHNILFFDRHQWGVDHYIVKK